MFFLFSKHLDTISKVTDCEPGQTYCWLTFSYRWQLFPLILTKIASLSNDSSSRLMYIYWISQLFYETASKGKNTKQLVKFRVCRRCLLFYNFVFLVINRTTTYLFVLFGQGVRNWGSRGAQALHLFGTIRVKIYFWKTHFFHFIRPPP